MAEHSDLGTKCDLLRSLHVPGRPLVLPNAWDVPSARAVVAAGFPVVATTSGGVAESLGHADHEGAPADQMLAAAGRIAAGVQVPVTVDAEAGYRMTAEDLVAALRDIGAAGCNLEDTRHPSETLADPAEHAAWLRNVRRAASDLGYGLVINARVDVFLANRDRDQGDLVAEGSERGRAYLDAGADCVFPIFLSEPSAVAAFVSGVGGPVNILAGPHAPSIAELAELGVARVSYGSLLFRVGMEGLTGALKEIAAGTPPTS
jgi:2-methylisocitrate lyase-like PEP mutase family enzyme